MEKLTTRLAMIAIIAGLYATLTIILGPLGYEAIQFRVSEALIALVIWEKTRENAVEGLTLGTFLANLFSPVGLPDWIIGPIATFVGAFLTKRSITKYPNRVLMALFFYFISVSVIISIELTVFYNTPFIESIVFVSIGEAVCIFLLGYPLALKLKAREVTTKE